MGTHPTAPSRVAGSGQTLSGWLAAHPQALGNDATDRFGVDLPFLFKVLTPEPWSSSMIAACCLTSVARTVFVAGQQPSSNCRDAAILACEPRCAAQSWVC